MLLNELISESNQIHGAGDRRAEQYFTQVVDTLCDQFSIPSNVRIDVSFNPKLPMDPGQEGLTIPNPNKPDHIFIFVKPGLSNGERVKVIAHEMVHVRQIVDGRMSIQLVNGKYQVKWEDKPVKSTGYSRSNPWEVEAFGQEHQLMQLLIAQHGNLS
jgi:hypothetical protein